MPGSPHSDPFTSSFEFEAVGGNYLFGVIVNDSGAAVHEFPRVGAGLGIRSGEMITIEDLTITSSDSINLAQAQVGTFRVFIFNKVPTSSFPDKQLMSMTFEEAKTLETIQMTGIPVLTNATSSALSDGYQNSIGTFFTPKELTLVPDQTSLFAVIISLQGGSADIDTDAKFQIKIRGIRAGGIS